MKGGGKPLEASAMAAAGRWILHDVDFFCFSRVLYSLAFTTKTKLSALISALISSLIHERLKKARFFDVSSTFLRRRRNVEENVSKRWGVMTFSCLFTGPFFKKTFSPQFCLFWHSAWLWECGNGSRREELTTKQRSNLTYTILLYVIMSIQYHGRAFEKRWWARENVASGNTHNANNHVLHMNKHNPDSTQPTSLTHQCHHGR